MKRFAGLLLVLTSLVHASTTLAVTVVEQKSGKPVSGLKAEDFVVTDNKLPLSVESAEYKTGLLDVLLLLDSSLVGASVQPVAASLIGQLQPKEQMSIVAFHSSADLIQDFTSSKELLLRALSNVKYGNSPRVLDALYASIDGGFNATGFRRVILLLTTGFEAPSGTTPREVVRIARRNGVSIYPVFVGGTGRRLFEDLAEQTGGASFSLRDMQKERGQPGPRIFEVLRGVYHVVLSTNSTIGSKLKVEVKRAGKFDVSAMPLDEVP